MLGYILRLDDACPTLDPIKWQIVEDFLDRCNIQPIVCIVPKNEDPQLQYSNDDSHFWEKAKNWEKKGWHIALHGFSHRLLSKKRGLVPINSFSEFAGVDIKIQQQKIQDGYSILCSNGIKPTMWCAPAHSFDKNTLQVLRDYTDIRIITDGIARFPFNKYGFLWLPQQLWDFEHRTSGIWSICLHINTITVEQILFHLKKFERNKSLFITPDVVIQNKYSKRKRDLIDILLSYEFFSRQFLRPFYHSVFNIWK